MGDDAETDGVHLPMGTLSDAFEKQSEERGEALKKLIEAWEALPSGQYKMDYEGAKKIDDWLGKKMSPAINNARKVLGK